VLHLACLDELFDGAGSVFDWSVGVDAMLIEEIDGVGLQALERTFDDLLDVVGPAVGRGPLAVIVRIRLKAKLGGNDDVPAKGSKTSPTTSSLMYGP
jgi:hypothetical protein